MSKFRLAFGIHNHQPIGNFEAVFDEAHQRSYAPFLEIVERHKSLSLSLHQSGILWRWQERRHPEFFELAGRMVDSGQIELLTGGFYEPILCSVPQRDAVGQIAMLTSYLKNHFDAECRGLWLTERIWEPHLPRLLSEAGVEFLPVDDTHFIYAGFEQSQLTGPFMTESEGFVLRLLPIQKKLRYLIPFGDVDHVISELRSQAERNPEGLAVYADDGEKFGVWPGTYDHCFTDGWLERFFEAVDRNSDWLEVVPLGKAAAMKPVGRAYLPTASYEEMLHWSLPTAAYLEYEDFERSLKERDEWKRYGRFVRGGHWRGFLAKYDESNLMHKRMTRASQLLERAEGTIKEESELLDRARDRLYAAQCNCPYWHGVFGGLYLPHIRQAVYGALVETEHDIRLALKQTDVTVESYDYDADGNDEIIITTNSLSAVFRPSVGGMLVDLSMLQHGFNPTDTLSRRKEGYHRKLLGASSPDTNGAASIHDTVVAKEQGLGDLLAEDWYLKRCFIDHFLGEHVQPDEFSRAQYEEIGDFTIESYSGEVEDQGRTVTLRRQGRVQVGDGTCTVSVIKRFRFEEDGSLTIDYLVKSDTSQPLKVRFGVENNFNFQAGHAEDRYVLVNGQRPQESYLDSRGSELDVRSTALVDEYRALAIGLEWDRNGILWRMPILTVSLSEGGFEKVYQGTTLLAIFNLTLGEEPERIRFRLNAGSLDTVAPAGIKHNGAIRHA